MTINNQKGFSLVQAIFILVVLALLGTYMVRLSTVGQATSTQALLQARAYQSARAGLEWGIAQIVDDASDVCFADWGEGTSPTIEGFCVKVMCDRSVAYSEGDDDFYLYNLTASASYPSDNLSSPDYVFRTLEVTIHD